MWFFNKKAETETESIFKNTNLLKENFSYAEKNLPSPKDEEYTKILCNLLCINPDSFFYCGKKIYTPVVVQTQETDPDSEFKLEFELYPNVGEIYFWILKLLSNEEKEQILKAVDFGNRIRKQHFVSISDCKIPSGTLGRIDFLCMYNFVKKRGFRKLFPRTFDFLKRLELLCILSQEFSTKCNDYDNFVTFREKDLFTLVEFLYQIGKDSNYKNFSDSWYKMEDMKYRNPHIIQAFTHFITDLKLYLSEYLFNTQSMNDNYLHNSPERIVNDVEFRKRVKNDKTYQLMLQIYAFYKFLLNISKKDGLNK